MRASEFLRKARGKRGIQDFASQVQCSATHIRDIEQGNRALTLANSTKWAKALGVSHQELVQLLLQDMLDKAKLGKRFRVEVQSANQTPPDLDENEWDAVNEMVHSGWKEADAIKEVVANRL